MSEEACEKLALIFPQLLCMEPSAKYCRCSMGGGAVVEDGLKGAVFLPGNKDWDADVHDSEKADALETGPSSVPPSKHSTQI